jgi:Fe-S-cluster containining protein
LNTAKSAVSTEVAALAASGTIPCRKGCSACCHLPVRVGVLDAILIAARVLTWPKARRDRLLAALDARCAAIDAMTANAYHRSRAPCAFLTADEACEIYHVRPEACRAWHAAEPDSSRCEAFTRDVENLPPRMASAKTLMPAVLRRIRRLPAEQVAIYFNAIRRTHDAESHAPMELLIRHFVRNPQDASRAWHGHWSIPPAWLREVNQDDYERLTREQARRAVAAGIITQAEVDRAIERWRPGDAGPCVEIRCPPRRPLVE